MLCEGGLFYGGDQVCVCGGVGGMGSFLFRCRGLGVWCCVVDVGLSSGVWVSSFKGWGCCECVVGVGWDVVCC